jgi:cysteine sulfinate desulfinase/cysteine desulfurase-like protein
MEHRLPGNINLSFSFVEGEAMMMAFIAIIATIIGLANL